MNRLEWLSIGALLVTMSCATTHADQGALPRTWDDRYLDNRAGVSAQPRLAVLPFVVGERLRVATDLRIGDMLTTALFKTGRFELVERGRINDVLEEQTRGQSGLVDKATAARIGELLGAQVVVFGVLSSATQQTIDRFAYDVVRTEVRIDARAVDTSTGAVTFTESADGLSEAKVVSDAHGAIISGARDTDAEFVRAAAQAAFSLSGKLGQQFPVVGTVVSVEGDTFVTDLGADRELALENQLVILRPVERLRHPVTGAYLGWRKKILGVAEVRAVDRASSVAKVLQHGEPGERIQVGDVAVVRPRE